MDIVAVIPARGGSKGIPRKNIQSLNGKPLLAYTIEAVIDSGITKDIYVSTDSDEVADIAINFGAQVIQRPPEISHDVASTESALIHAIEVIGKSYGRKPEYILTLPPTSPLREPKTIRDFVAFFQKVSKKYDAMLSLTETRGDYWIKGHQGDFRRLFPDAPRRRQDREPVYLENSAIYITETESLLKTNSILGSRCTGFIINNIEAVDINEPVDLKWAELVLRDVLNRKE